MAHLEADGGVGGVDGPGACGEAGERGGGGHGELQEVRDDKVEGSTSGRLNLATPLGVPGAARDGVTSVTPA
ncbi:hypothetical protein GCM10027047_03580 [Rhodococcus aerolatus]